MNDAGEGGRGNDFDKKIEASLSSSDVERILICPSVFDYPGRLVEPTAWAGHIPFAFWLIDAHRPGLLVELGTHTGNSYSAFAQTVQRLALPTQCYAVDTWRGDEHAGFYADAIFEEFSTYHNTRYRSFSRLLRSTFDDARQYFKDGSIDLLHIDGLHTYDAVKHDFDTWLPKLSNRAVVLFHDVNVRENNFGVWELWGELSKRYPHFCFDHSHGLGVLGVGTDLGPRMKWLFSLSEDAAPDSGYALTRAFFGRLGGALLDGSALQKIEQQVRSAKSDFELANQGVLSELNNLRAEREKVVTHFEAAHAELEVLRRERTVALDSIRDLESRMRAADRELVTLRSARDQQLKHAESLELQNRQSKIGRLTGGGLLGRIIARLGTPLRLVRSLNLGSTGLLLGRSPLFVRVALTARHPLSRAHRREHFGRYQSMQRAIADLVALFDARWYRQHNTDLDGSDSGLLFHYLERGWKEGRDPSPLFDTKFYLERYPDAAQSGKAPLAHYIRSGAAAGHWPHPLFDPEFYRAEVEAAGGRIEENPLLHYLRNEGVAFEGRSTHALFDTAHYLSQVAQAGESVTQYPLIHFLQNWHHLHRSPSPVFDATYYAAVYTDVSKAGINPLVHYVSHGRLEGRRASHEFDPSTYLALNPDVAQSGQDPFTHYVRFGQAEGRRSAYLSIGDLKPGSQPKSLARPAVYADVIVPVYGGVAETRRCIESVLAAAASNATIGRIIVVDDHGPDPQMREYLAELRRDTRITLLDNQRNLGFVASVNRGMEFAAPNDVILLNSDTEVNGNWVDRLAAQAHQHSKIGSVTPFTNNGTICSYPAMPGSSLLPDGETAASLDDVFRTTNAGQSVDLPTAVGFCMYIKRACLETNGLFDVEAFGRGYGEENDFCLRSAARGWRHILAGDVFVYHVGETSFGADSAPNKQNATRVLLERYPNYLRDVGRAASLDAPLRLRIAATAARFAQGNRPVVLMILHGLGGGTEKHARELARRFGSDVRCLFLKIESQSLFTLFGADEGDGLKVLFRDSDQRELAEFMRSFGVERVHVHHILGYEGDFQNLLQLIGVPYDITVHDYMLACPRVLLFRPNMKYCGEPDEIGCLSCLQETPTGLSTDIISWRWMGRQLLEGAERVICPSIDVARRMLRYANGANLFLAPHEDPAVFKTRAVSIPRLKAGEPIRIVILGHVAGHKGGDFLTNCVAACQKAGVDARFKVIGNLVSLTDEADKAGEAAIEVTGPYKSEDVGRLIADADPHLIFYPQRSPETYSYTFSEGLQAGIPLLVPAIGAFPERAAGLEWCWLYDLATSPGDLAHLLAMIRKDHLETGNGPAPVAEFPLQDGVKAQTEWFYRSEFLSWATKPSRDQRRLMSAS